MTEQPMDLSVIVVNYNVEHFLAQCLMSVRRAVADAERRGYRCEVVVVDNRSVDGSCALVAERFPEVKLIALDENVGFARANNLAIRATTGRWVLLLNPDTVVQEDTFSATLEWADAHPRLGGCGVPMYDGSGRYLPESKRGLPTPWAACCKITGLYRIAPTSARLNRYYLGHLPRDRDARIEILSGAFMWMRREALDQVGLLDEAYFMYGEDIDLSWRLIQGGWENHYFAGTRIIHYKGESTKKGSLNYVLVFYRAMGIFARTHFAGREARVLLAAIHAAIWLRAGLAVASRLSARWGPPLLDAAAGYAGLMGLVSAYGQITATVYPARQVAITLAVYTAVWVLALAMRGAYDRPWRPGASLRGLVTGTLVLLVGYALLPEGLRFSRAILLLGAVWMLAVTFGLRTLLFGRHWLRRRGRRRLVVAGPDDGARILEGVRSRGEDASEPLALHPSAQRPPASSPASDLRYVGGLSDLAEAIRVHRIDEVVFSGRDVPAADIIGAMAAAAESGATFRIAWSDGGPWVGPGGPLAPPLTGLQRAIHLPAGRREKRMFDLCTALVLVLAAPVLVLAGRRSWAAAAWKVLRGRATWVGYAGAAAGLPRLAPEVLRRAVGEEDKVAERLDFHYARDYRWVTDFRVVADALISRPRIPFHGHH